MGLVFLYDRSRIMLWPCRRLLLSKNQSNWLLPPCSISYRFWVTRGWKLAMPKFSKLFYLSSDFDGFFFSFDSLWKCRKSYSKHFFVSFTVFFLKKGVQRVPKCHMGYGKILFFVRFWWDFFHLIPLSESFQMYVNRILLSLTVFEIIWVKIVKRFILAIFKF